MEEFHEDGDRFTYKTFKRGTTIERIKIKQIFIENQKCFLQMRIFIVGWTLLKILRIKVLRKYFYCSETKYFWESFKSI